MMKLHALRIVFGIVCLVVLLSTAVSAAWTVTAVGGGTVQSSLQLAPAPDAGWAFDHWEGSLTGTANPASIQVDGNGSVVAVFRRLGAQHSLTVAAQGGGLVAPISQGKYAPGAVVRYDVGTIVTASAIPYAGWAFDHWEGDLAGSDSRVDLVMDSGKSITAVFRLLAATHRLTITAQGHGAVTADTGGPYEVGSTVVLTALPPAGWVFDHWEGGLTGSTNPATIVVDSSRSIVAVFRQLVMRPNLTITAQGTGTVTADTGGPYDVGSTVVLTAVPATGWVFHHWEGGLTGTANPASVVLGSSSSVVAVFEQPAAGLAVTDAAGVEPDSGQARLSLASAAPSSASLPSTTTQDSGVAATVVSSVAPDYRTSLTDGTTLVLIPSGSFLSGSGKVPADLPAYYMALTEVTNAQYARFLTSRKPNPADLEKWILLGDNCFVRALDTGAGLYEPYGAKENHPVVLVSWFGAVAYCEWAGLRLPTGLEWEKAARGTDGRVYPWGDTWDEGKCRNFGNSGLETTADVKAYPEGRSPWGMYQMAGNVWEWTADSLTAGTPSSAGADSVLRGGSWASWNDVDIDRFSCAFRLQYDPALMYSNFGFRCAATL